MREIVRIFGVPTGDALKGGGDVGSRAHGAAWACVVPSGLFMCGLGGALAIAEPPSPPGNPGATHSNEAPGKGADSDGSGGSKVNTDGKPDTRDNGDTDDGKPDTGDNGDTDDGKPDTGDSGDTDNGKTGNGGNPNNGNCGNDGSNGNAQHCGGGASQSSQPSVTSPTKTTTETSMSTTKTTTKTSTSTKTTTSATTTRRTTSSETTTGETTSSETTTGETTSSETSETTTATATTPPGPGGDGGGVEMPSGRPELPPQMQLPPELMPPAFEPSAIDVAPGVGVAAAELPIPLIPMPVIVAPAAGLGGGGGSAGAPGSPALPGTPRGVTAEPPAGREPLPANVGSNVAVPASSYRIGYPDYLRSAGLSQVAALAVPGIAGILVLTGAGGLVGYRQAKAGHAVHPRIARFVN